MNQAVNVTKIMSSLPAALFEQFGICSSLSFFHKFGTVSVSDTHRIIKKKKIVIILFIIVPTKTLENNKKSTKKKKK